MSVPVHPGAGRSGACYSEFQGFVKQYEDISAFILCGGASSRMCRDKGLLEIGGQPLISRIARLVRSLVPSVTVIGPPQRYDALGLRVIADRNFESAAEASTMHGPLAGIATALAATDTAWNLIVACDLPYLTGEWVDWLLARATNSQQQIVMPRTERGPEPLAAVYHRECAEPMAELLGRGIRKALDAIGQFRVEFVFERDWRQIDPGGRVLRNMNTPADYDEAVALLGKP
jgi:molybdopterin-guanine dinucleotide biosynthesis protein A